MKGDRLQVFYASTADAATSVAVWMTSTLAQSSGRYIGLAVGDSTLPLYAELFVSDRSWLGRVITPIDELMPPPHSEGFTFLARLQAALPPGLRELAEPVATDLATPDAIEARTAEEGLAAVVLGLGPDGHIAFNQPGSGIDSRARYVELDPVNLARLGNVAPATGALTMGVATLLSADRVLLAVGSGKQEALRRVLKGPVAADMPATFLRNHRDVTVLVIDQRTDVPA